MTQKFKHYDLLLVEPEFSSPLTDLVIDLNNLRNRQLRGSTHPQIFFQLKQIFHTVESIGSARIEGNNTTITEYIATKLEQQPTHSEKIKEIQNIEKAMTFVEEHAENHPINKIFISEMHKLVVENLSPTNEGDRTPGYYRNRKVVISNATHLPPDYSTVNSYMNELFEFIKHRDSPKYDLLKIAIAHHRFVWIHPFANGNGRTVRLFTYAMLIKFGFNVKVGRILNPTAIFCNHRDNYYHYLSKADKGEKAGILSWCEYVLQGLKNEIEKIDKLLDYKYLCQKILFPTITYALERQYITKIESQILKKAIEEEVIKAADVKVFLVIKKVQRFLVKFEN